MLDETDIGGCPKRAALLELAGKVLAGSARWGRGRLCMTGAPIEQTFVSVHDAVRLTLEPDDPAGGAQGQLGRCLTWIEAFDLDGSGFNTDWLEAIKAGQNDLRTPLRFGAWLGLRARYDDPTPAAKIYAEAPELGFSDFGRLVSSCLGNGPTGAGLPGQATVVGLSADGSTEVYFAARDLLPSAVGRILDVAGQGGRSSEVIELLAELTLSQSRARLPVRDIGYSYAVATDGTIGAVTVYTTALGLFGRDSVLATRLAGAAEQLGGDLSDLAEAIAGKPELPAGELHCGMVGITIAPKAAPILSCGIALDEGIAQ